MTALSCNRGQDKPEVVVYVAVDRKDAEPLLRQYEAETGVQVKALYDGEAAKTTGLVTRLMAERKHPRCDVFWNNEIVQTMQLAQQGMLAGYGSPEAASLEPPLVDKQHRWTGVAVRARVIVYNTDLVAADEAPQTLADLLDERWRGKLAIANPQFGTTRTHVAAMFAAWGPTQAQAYLNGLLANEVRIVDGNAMVKNLVGRAQPGASPVLVGLTDTDDVMSGKAEGMPLEMIFPDQDSQGTLVIPSTICLLDQAPHAQAGQRLIDHLLSAPATASLTGADTGYYRPAEFAELESTAGKPLRAMAIDYQDILEQLEPSTRWTAEYFHR